MVALCKDGELDFLSSKYDVPTSFFVRVAITSWKKLFDILRLKPVVRSTGAMYILCPFHREKKPSLRVWPDEPLRFKCFGCGKVGTMEKFLIEYCGWRIDYDYVVDVYYESDAQLLLNLDDQKEIQKPKEEL